MYAHVIPTIRIPAHVSERYYTYIVPEELRDTLTHGMVVEVPFRKRKVQGIVIKTVSRNTSGVKKDKLQTISRLLHPEALLTAEQIQLANYLVRSARVSYPLAYKTLLPEIPKRSIKTDTPPSSLHSPLSSLRKQGSRKPSLDTKTTSELFTPSITKALTSKSTYILHHSHAIERDNLIHQLAEKLDPDKQLLIIVPELEDIPHMEVQLKNYEISTITSKLTKTAFFGQYKAISSKSAKIVLGTRKALFMPFYSLGAIFIAQAHSSGLQSLKQKPHYTTLDIADFLRIAHQCPVFLATDAPTQEMWNQMQNKEITPISQQTSNFQLPTSKLIDMTEESRKEHYSPLSDDLRKKIKQTVEKNKSGDVFIFHNRKGYSTLISCKKCEHTFTCPTCDKPLVSHNVGATEHESLHCGNCGHQEDMPPLCSECNNPDFFFRGKGTQKIAALLAKEFPEVEVIRLDKDSPLSLRGDKVDEAIPTRLPRSQSSLAMTKTRIIVGTIFALPRIDWSRIALVGVINLDPMLVLPDPEAHMHVYQMLRRMGTYLSSSLAGKQELLLQTYSPTLPLYQAVAQNKPDIFYTHEEEIKKSLKPVLG